MFWKIRKEQNNINLVKEKVDDVDRNVKMKKNRFNKEWNKWGMKKIKSNKLP